ncbi:MAG TPA: protein kinase, partial [Myxococcaceae bacterium]|nr:protein kinase [Myxococcaceae bacterium]
MFNRLSIGPITHLRISGMIDETFAPQSIARDLTGHVILDLGRVERISSFGVRKWIEFAGKMPAGANGLYVVHAPPAIVDQLNMVEGFGGVTQVLSVLAPYNCNKCGEDRVRLVDLHADAPIIAEGKAPPHDCPVCGSQLQFADLPAEFFDYARHQTLPPVDPAVARYLKTLQPVEPSKDEVAAHVKLVHDDITFFRVSNVLRGDLNVRKLGSGLEGRVIYDFGQVAVAEPEAGPKLQQILEAASQGAQVYLWRVPPEVLGLLSATGKPLPGSLSTLYLPCDCRNCGSRSRQRIDAQLYVRGLMAGNPGEVQCGICGGQARVPVLREYASFLTSAPLAAMKGDEVEALEPRALSQYLAGASDTGSGGGKQESATGNNLGSSLKLQILRRLGQGGMAEVFLARQVGIKGFEKYVVVKKILENLASQPDFVEMLFAEARANARLTHQNIVQTYDVGVMGGVAYITMEYVRGPDVKKLMTLARKAGVQVPISHVLRIVAETAAGLHYAHSYVDPTGKQHPMVHRDVSPHNILLSLDGAIKLSDFGIAKVQGEADNTRPGTFKGKIAYLSPEAIAGMQLDARSDVFALGVTLFELLTGRLPFRRENEAATLHAIMREPAPNLAKLNPAVPDDLSALVSRSMEKDPARRVQSAGEFHRELEAVMNRHSLNASPTAVAM